ncbi:hypothetical protein KXS07_37195, partial [Inquilinus limosus]|uniref:phage baseplate assembly protein V n=1 Tax=Inquilinus limosus TaxID=171674 RepID=UPI003F17500B
GTQYIAGAFWEGGEPGETGYRNTISAIRHATPYRSPRRTPRPIMAGVMPAMIDAPDDYNDRAVLDAEGRYKVVANFDMAGLGDARRRTAVARMAQPYAGAKAGLHFPLARGTEVALGWEDGDPDRPIILGTVPHSRTLSPVTSRNPTENRIQTLAGTTLVMNDGTPNGEAAAPVYLSMQVPVPEAAPPDYLRMGDVPTADARVERAILATPEFGADAKCGRPSELSSSPRPMSSAATTPPRSAAGTARSSPAPSTRRSSPPAATSWPSSSMATPAALRAPDPRITPRSRKSRRSRRSRRSRASGTRSGHGTSAAPSPTP